MNTRDGRDYDGFQLKVRLIKKLKTGEKSP